MKRANILTAVTASAALLCVILDAGSCTKSAADAVDLCIRTLIPSLFPMIFLSAYLADRMSSISFKALRPLEKVCRIPDGSLFLLGLIAGYPAGAQCIGQNYRNGGLSKDEAERMLSFCSNAGPAFLFGIVGAKFENYLIPWILWGIMILSALLTAFLMPGKAEKRKSMIKRSPMSIKDCLEKSVKTMGVICGWVILFRLVSDFLTRWFLWLLPVGFQLLITGLIEISNGFFRLSGVAGFQFILSSVFLNFGGICILMQTGSVIGDLSLKRYFPGKVIQAVISAFLSLPVQALIFPPEDRIRIPIAFYGLGVLLTAMVILLGKIGKNNSRFSVKRAV